jgi:DMSO reductase anchor subunit
MVLDLKFAEIQKANDVDLHAQVIRYYFAGLTALIIVLVIFSFVVVHSQIRLLSQGDVVARTSLRLLTELYMPLFVVRLVLLFYASISLGLSVYRMYKLKTTPQSMMMPVYLSCLMILIGEIVGRFLFYATHIRVGL